MSKYLISDQLVLSLLAVIEIMKKCEITTKTGLSLSVEKGKIISRLLMIADSCRAIPPLAELCCSKALEAGLCLQNLPKTLATRIKKLRITREKDAKTTLNQLCDTVLDILILCLYNKSSLDNNEKNNIWRLYCLSDL